MANPAPPPAAEDALTDEASLQPLLKPDDHVLAFKRHALTGDGKDDAVAIVRYATAEVSGNTCQLLVLQQENSQSRVSDRSPQVVDCLYNAVARNAKRLDDNLTLATGKLVDVNQQARSNVTYTLNYKTAKTACVYRRGEQHCTSRNSAQRQYGGVSRDSALSGIYRLDANRADRSITMTDCAGLISTDTSIGVMHLDEDDEQESNKGHSTRSASCKSCR